MNSKFCPIPWLYVALRNNGNFRVCCHSNVSADKGLLKKKDGSCFNIASDSIADARQSDLMNEVRLSMLNNESHSTCSRCDKEDLAGMRSRRQYEKERAIDMTIDKAEMVTNLDGTLKLDLAPVGYMDLRFGNRCNLKCRMCGPSDSDMWYEDHVNLWSEEWFNDGDSNVELVQGTNGRWVANSDQYQWIESENAWNEIKANIQNLHYVYIVGGEPLLVDGHINLLQECIDQGVSQNITLEYNTNLTVLPERILLLWKSFKLVRVGISIDGIGKANDYIRAPSKWDNVISNFKKLVEHNSKLNFEIWFSLTFQAYNIFHVIEVFEWVKINCVLSEDKRFNNVTLKTHPLHQPHFHSAKIYSDQIKQNLKQYYDDYIKKIESEFFLDFSSNSIFNEFLNHTKKSLNGFIRFINAEDLSSNFELFCDVTKKLDTIRAEKINHSLPEIGKIIYDSI